MLAARAHLEHLVRVDSADIRGDFVRLDRNERVSPLPDDVLREILTTMDPRTLSSYPDPKPLIDAFAAAAQVAPACVVAANGSDAVIRRTFQAFVAPGDRVVMANPSYAMYAIYARVAEAESIELEYSADRRLAPDRWRAAIAQGPRLLCLANPDNPTGAVLPREDVLAIVQAAATRDVLCLIDETYHPCHPDTVIDAVRSHSNLLVVRSLSKAYGLGGVRVGFGCAQPPIVDAIGKVRGLHEVNGVAIHAARYMLSHPEIVRRLLAEIEAGRAVLAAWARRHGFGLPVCPATFQLIELPPDLDPATMVAALRDRGFLVKGGFRAPSLSRCLRLTLDGPPLVRRFVEAFEGALAQEAVYPSCLPQRRTP